MKPLKIAIAGAVLLAAVSSPAQNLLVNGNFESGNTGFATTYHYTPGDLLDKTKYDVVSNPYLDNPYAASMGDHTSGAGLMLALNGSTNTNDVVWSESVNVSPNSSYSFSIWAASWAAPYPAAKLKFFINGSQVGSDVLLPNQNGQWTNFVVNWSSASATQAVIQIYDVNSTLFGNALALDDLTFSKISQNLLVNGDFEAGNVGFTNEIPYSPGNLGPANTYDVVSDPHLDNPFGISVKDHTTGSGLMFAANGGTNANTVGWSQTVNVQPNTTYMFSGWTTSWGSGAYPPAILRVSINGSLVGTNLPTPATSGQWTNFVVLWNSESSTQAVIQILDAATSELGNDFALDDLSFAEASNAVKIYKAVEVSWPSVSNQLYQVQWVSTLSGNSWSNLGPAVLATNTTTSIFDRVQDWENRFYRVQDVPQ